MRFVDDEYINAQNIKVEKDASEQSQPQYEEGIELSDGEEQVDDIMGVDEADE